MKRWAVLLLTLLAMDGAVAAPLVIAHRGGFPENRMEAFLGCAELGADGFELDIHLTADNQIVVIHDDTLDRTFGRPGKVAEMTRSELEEAGVPFLDEVLKIPHGKLVIEIKHAGLEEQLVDLLERTGNLERSIVISFDKEALRRIHDLKPGLPTGYLFYLPTDIAAVQRELGVRYLGPNHRLVTRELVQQAHSLGMKVNPWTVNSEADMKRMLEAGCDAITTDHPQLLKGLLDGK